MRIMTAYAIGLSERLILVRFLQIGTLRIVAIETKCRSSLGEMKIELKFAHFPCFMDDVAAIAPHVERGMAAAFLGNIESGFVAGQAEVVFLVA